MKVKVNPNYVSGQLERALALGQSADKLRKWRQAFDGLIGGTLDVGSRTPVADAPAWATLEVVTGGFATGSLLASGALQPHEQELEAKLDASGVAPGRTALNLYYLSDAGREELAKMLRTGCYRVHVPEEGALLTAVWLLEHGATGEAGELLETIAPFFDRLRFYPVPHPRPLPTGTDVKRQPISETVANLRAAPAQKRVLAMNEALAIWAPLYDRVVALFHETVQDGRPCRVYPPGWAERANALLAEYARLRQEHGLCNKPEKKKASFTRLRGYLAKAASSPPSLAHCDDIAIKNILAEYAAKYGPPEKLARLRAAQAEMASRPTSASLRAVAIDRLLAMNDRGKDEGLSSLEAFSDMPSPIVRKVARSLEAPVEELVAKGVLPSAEVLAVVLPPMTSQIRAAAIPDPDLRRVYAAVYGAFRRRRSLLLLNLEKQVRIEELPWIAAMSSFRTTDAAVEAASSETLDRVSLLALKSYPQTILPNKLITELRALATGAKRNIPFVGELAVDIFTGAFSAPFLHAAQIAGRRLAGTLYERYYGLPYAEVARIDDVKKTASDATTSSPAFAALCARLAPPRKDGASRTAANGTVIEQSQLLTTHNLAPLFAETNLASDAPALARACFTWVCHAQQRKRTEWHSRLRMVKNTAYAWRQMLFLLSVGAEPPDAFMRWAEEQFAKQTEAWRARFSPAMLGLRAIVDGGRFDDAGMTPDGGRRFLGWTTERHWVLGPRDDVPAQPGMG